MNVSIIILTYNSENNIEDTITSASKLSDDIHVVDSYSEDKTLSLLDKFKVKVYQRKFVNYSDQRNWTIKNLKKKYEWELHLDSDEILTEQLIKEIKSLPNKTTINGYFIGRIFKFMNKLIKYGGFYPTWQLRLFKNGIGKNENRLYDQHFIVNGKKQKLENYFVDDIRQDLSTWTARHNKWSDAESEQYFLEKSQEINPRIFGSPIEKKRFYRKIYDHLPLFFRPFILFFYRYFFRLGFLDGRKGFIFYFLQCFWFRFLIDAKIYEKKKLRSSRN